MEPPSLLISWVNPFPSRFINRIIFFYNALAACCHFSIFIGSFLYQRAKPPKGIVLFINLLGKGLTPRACMGHAGSIWWVPDFGRFTWGVEWNEKRRNGSKAQNEDSLIPTCSCSYNKSQGFRPKFWRFYTIWHETFYFVFRWLGIWKRGTEI